MKRLIKRWIASAMLSMSIVGATVGLSYGQDKVVRIGFQKYGKLVLQSYGIKPITEGVVADQQQVADAFFALGLIKISDAARRPGT